MPTTYEVRQVEVAARSVAAVRAEVPFGKVAEYYGRSLDQVYAAGRRGAVTLDGQNIFIYRHAAAGVLTVDFGVGTAGPFPAVGEVQWRETPAGVAVSTVHWGSYAGLRGAHDAVQQWRRDHNLTFAGPSWEVYGHWNDDPAKVRTDIYYLIQPS